MGNDTKQDSQPHKPLTDKPLEWARKISLWLFLASFVVCGLMGIFYLFLQLEYPWTKDAIQSFFSDYGISYLWLFEKLALLSSGTFATWLLLERMRKTDQQIKISQDNITLTEINKILDLLSTAEENLHGDKQWMHKKGIAILKQVRDIVYDCENAPDSIKKYTLKDKFQQNLNIQTYIKRIIETLCVSPPRKATEGNSGDTGEILFNGSFQGLLGFWYEIFQVELQEWKQNPEKPIPLDFRLNLEHADLAGANLERANLVGAYLVNANLVGAYLVNANLVNANLAGAHLAGANLERAHLVAANLEWANLERANFVAANLSFARLSIHGQECVWGGYYFKGQGVKFYDSQHNEMTPDEPVLCSVDLEEYKKCTGPLDKRRYIHEKIAEHLQKHGREIILDPKTRYYSVQKIKG